MTKTEANHMDWLGSELARLTVELAVSQARESNLAMFVRRMRRVMGMNGLADREVCRQATTYLKAIGATGSVLRDEDIQEQAAEKGGGDCRTRGADDRARRAGGGSSICG